MKNLESLLHYTVKSQEKAPHFQQIFSNKDLFSQILTLYLMRRGILSALVRNPLAVLGSTLRIESMISQLSVGLEFNVAD
ncbi:hypothetical protein [Salinicoccus halitifaciens]|uniref:Uncharacterized protein n=1 Tax=Salinicoccus halitifaciens TaxID=1073415 RepID=A0ABV2E9V5_9STAP|nr:hypothetical protein [Salinicoccus halitifaciens]